MSCCHADFAAVEGSDRGFTVGMPTFTFGRGVLAEAGDNARELGLKRVALFTDARLASSEYVATVKASLAAAGVDAAIYGDVAVEPTDVSFQEAARFAADGRFDGYVSVGGGSVMDTCKAANLYASQPAEFMTYVNAPIGAGQKVPGPVKPHIACPTTSGTGSETTGIAIFALRSINAKTGIISRRLIPDVALIDPTVTATLPEERRRRDRFRLHEPRARIADRPRVSTAAQPGEGREPPGVAGGESVLRHAGDRGAQDRRPLSRARGQRCVRLRGAHRDDVRGDARGHRLQRGRLSSAARVVLCGVGAGAELARRRLPGGQDARPARHGRGAQQPVGVAVHGAVLSRAAPARRPMPRRRNARRGRRRRGRRARRTA